MKKNMNTIKALVLQIFNYILAIIIFFITYYFDFFNFANKYKMSAIPSFLLSIIALMIGQTIYMNVKIDKVSSDSKEVCETVRTYLQLTKIGNPKNAWEYIMNRLTILEYVQNTSFNFDDEYENSSERFYDVDLYQKSINKIAKQIDRGLTWKDLGDISAIDRFNNLKECIKNKNNSKYQFKIIQQSEPQIGFIILTYKDGITEVLFNWDFRDIPSDPIVLLSRDTEIINMFAAQYKGLWRVAVENYDSKATKSTS